MLQTGGRCASIVPDGVLFGNSTGHKSIRKELIDNHRLEAVISMPSGVFQPYSGVSTAILIFTKTNAGGTDKVWFYDMKADGYVEECGMMANSPELVKAGFFLRNANNVELKNVQLVGAVTDTMLIDDSVHMAE